MTSRLFVFLGVAAVTMALAGGASAAQKPVSQAAVVSETFTIEAIDHAARIVTLKDKDGLLEDVLCGPEVQRFDALKVGDRVTFRYHESLVTAIRRPGAAAKAPEAASVTRTPGSRPGATISQQMTTTVTLEAIDPKVPSVTIRSKDGRRMSFKVENAKNLEGYKAGDQVEVTYTQALAVSVAPAK
jgi:Cu/Ag efflux protein CusF